MSAHLPYNGKEAAEGRAGTSRLPQAHLFTSMPAEATIGQLPGPVLAHVFTLVGTHPNDILAILTTCKEWCAVAEQECTSWWESVAADLGKLLPEEGASGPAWTSALAGIEKRVGKLRSLSVTSRRRDSAYLTLLTCAACCGGPALQHLHLNAIHEAEVPQTCQVIGSLRNLQRLALELDIPKAPAGQEEQPYTPLSALAPLSALTQLQDMEIDLPGCTGEVPEELFSGFVHLTRLKFSIRALWAPSVWDPVLLPWCRPAATSMPLRELQLRKAFLQHPQGMARANLRQLTRLRLEDMHFTIEDDLDMEQLAALCQLEQLQCLELADFGTPPHLLVYLPRFRHLTRLQLTLLPPAEVAMEDGPEAEFQEYQQERLSLGAVLHCAQLRELLLGWSCLYRAAWDDPHVPPGALQQLTRLELDCLGCCGPVKYAPMCELPALHSLMIDIDPEGREEEDADLFLSSELSRLQTLQELVLRRCQLFYTEEHADVRTQLAALSQLERLDMETSCTGKDFWATAPGCWPHLSHVHAGFFSTANLPAVCQLAESAKLLDVSGAQAPADAPGTAPRIQPADVELFRPLAALRTLLLPLRPASSELGAQRQAELEVVEHFRRELPGVDVMGVEAVCQFYRHG